MSAACIAELQEIGNPRLVVAQIAATPLAVQSTTNHGIGLHQEMAVPHLCQMGTSAPLLAMERRPIILRGRPTKPASQRCRSFPVACLAVGAPGGVPNSWERPFGAKARRTHDTDIRCSATAAELPDVLRLTGISIRRRSLPGLSDGELCAYSTVLKLQRFPAGKAPRHWRWRLVSLESGHSTTLQPGASRNLKESVISHQSSVILPHHQQIT